MLRTKIPLYQPIYSQGWKTYIVFRWCNLSCWECTKTFKKSKIYYVKIEELVKQIIKLKNKTVVFTGWEPSIYEPLIADIQELVDKHNKYKDFFEWNWEIITNWTRVLYNYYDKITVTYKISEWVIHSLKAFWNRVQYIFTIEKLEHLIIFEEIMLTHKLKNIILQTKNPDIRLKDYCEINWFTYKKYTNVY